MKLKLTAALVLFLSFFLVACLDKVPIKELSKAKEAIELASSVKADKYSPEEFKAANDLLLKAHSSFIVDEKLDESVKNSELAYAKAMEAYNRSAVLYSADSLKKADEAITAAEAVYAEKLSPDLFAQSKELYTSANEKFENKDYIASTALSDESFKKAVKAKEESLDNKYQLQVKIDEVHAVLSKVEQYDYEEYAGEKYNIAKSRTEEAEKSYNSDALKSGFEAIETAKINAEESYKLTMDGVTSRKLSEAEDVVSEAENSNGASVAEEDLAAAKEALNNAKNLKNSGNYDESITYSNEAIRLGNNVIEEGKKSAVVAASVKNQNKDKDGDKAVSDSEKGKTAAKTKSEFVEEDENYYYYKVKTWEKYQECLSRIAEQYYKNAKAWKRIHNANKGIIKNPDLIRPGWIIKIPKTK
ncbi:MAG TPA: LysM peptidoglycan-binding domain-containing protein [Spirochaetota bacterium]|nr:LysM peptidoglycan-binding domain-containing protein [Spirochaetota bacterium]HPS86699.1 LysM peptidoglycan-binding domain-containing protein [Spirochaetota bacterium]